MGGSAWRTAGMNIDYAKIIESADKRRESLQKLNDLIAGASRIEIELREALGWLKDVQSVFVALDKEGHELLPASVKLPLEYVSSTVVSLENALDNRLRNPGGAPYGVAYMVEGDDE